MKEVKKQQSIEELRVTIPSIGIVQSNIQNDRSSPSSSELSGSTESMGWHITFHYTYCNKLSKIGFTTNTNELRSSATFQTFLFQMVLWRKRRCMVDLVERVLPGTK